MLSMSPTHNKHSVNISCDYLADTSSSAATQSGSHHPHTVNEDTEFLQDSGGARVTQPERGAGNIWVSSLFSFCPSVGGNTLKQGFLEKRKTDGQHPVPAEAQRITARASAWTRDPTCYKSSPEATLSISRALKTLSGCERSPPPIALCSCGSLRVQGQRAGSLPSAGKEWWQSILPGHASSKAACVPVSQELSHQVFMFTGREAPTEKTEGS